MLILSWPNLLSIWSTSGAEASFWSSWIGCFSLNDSSSLSRFLDWDLVMTIIVIEEIGRCLLHLLSAMTCIPIVP